MSHLLTLCLCLIGFAALALGTRRQQRDVFGKPLPLKLTYAFRAAGIFALLLALGILVGFYGWGLGLVMFSGHTSIAAGVVLCALIGKSRTDAHKAPR